LLSIKYTNYKKEENQWKSMKQIIIITLLILIFTTSCSQTDFTKEELEQIVCTADVSECPDGSFVGRNSLNNCEFKECPEESLKE